MLYSQSLKSLLYSHNYCIIIILVFMSIGLFSCKKPKPFNPTTLTLEVPKHFPTPAIPSDNPLTEEKVLLGKKLFFDPILSGDQTVSCGSCHLPSKAFSDTTALSIGINGKKGSRNAPPLINPVYGERFFWDGANPSLEEQAIQPILNELELGGDFEVILERLNNHPDYPQLFKDAFNEVPSTANILDAIASFERTLISANSPYDRYLAGDENAISESAKRGLALFNSEQGECFHCHTGFNFTDESFQNNGLYIIYEDEGRAAVTGRDNDRAKFKTPTLRNIEFTAPYMHDGSMKTLEEVLDHYASQGQPHPNRSIFMRNIDLTLEDRRDLINFLKSLGDPEFLNNPDFRE